MMRAGRDYVGGAPEYEKKQKPRRGGLKRERVAFERAVVKVLKQSKSQKITK